MRLLLDTHIALWAILDDERLPERARKLIADPSNEAIVSAASLWEIAIKHALRREGAGAMPISAQTALDYFTRASFPLLPVAAHHAAGVETLPLKHSDPFDRILVAQAVVEPLRLLTHDRTVASYSESFILV